MEQDKRYLNFYIRFIRHFHETFRLKKAVPLTTLNVSWTQILTIQLIRGLIQILRYQLSIRINSSFLANKKKSIIEFLFFFFPLLPFPLLQLFPRPESAWRTYVIQIAIRACVPLSRSHSQMDARPLDSPFFPPPVKIFFSLVQHKLSRNYDSFVPSTMLIGMRVHARDRRAHISTRRLRNGAYTLGWRLHCLAEYVPDTLLYCAVSALPSITYLAPSFKFLQSISPHFPTQDLSSLYKRVSLVPQTMMTLSSSFTCDRISFNSFRVQIFRHGWSCNIYFCCVLSAYQYNL